MLVQSRESGQVKILTLSIDPWKDVNYEKPFDLTESLAFMRSDIELKLRKNDSCLSRGYRIKKILM